MRKRKLYYIPGLISLLGLPVLLYYFGPREPTWLTTLSINLPTEDARPDPPNMNRFSKWYVYQSLKHKKIVTVDLDDGRFDLENPLEQFVYLKKLDFISGEIARRQFTHDTASVLKIEIGDHSTFGDFVWLLNQAKVYRIRRFAFIDDAFFLFTTPPPQPEPLELLQSPPAYTYNDIIIPKEVLRKPGWWEVLKMDLSEWLVNASVVIKRSLIYILGFLLLIATPAIYHLKKKSH